MIFPFDKISKNDANKAGGKGASLGEMTQAGIAIPPGFVVLAETFEEFVDSNNLRAEIQTILGELDHNNVGSIEHASEKIQELIRGGIISEKIQKEIQKYTKTIKTDFVAVRSSATAEDGAEHAWAGQLDTYLNVPKTDIITKIQSCWASLFTPRALFYRSEKGLGDLHISVAVVVQSMVDAESAGVAFSVHPVTENTDEIVIEGSWGLGEAVVSGEVTPDSFVISKSLGEIISEHIAEKKKGIFRNIHGENEWRDIENRVQEKPILTKKELSELSQLIIKIENHYGFPCDIEWAHAEGKIYILQARPITTLKGKINSIKKDWVNIWSGSWSFLSCTDFASALSHEVKILGEAPFNNVRIFINNGKSACWVPQDEKDTLGKKIADFYGNKKELEKVCASFKASVDDFMSFFETIKHKKIENKNYRKMWDLIVSEYRLHIIIKYIVDYLEPKLLNKFLPMLAEARVYAEPVFEKSEELMNNWIGEVAQKSKIESRYISCCTREEFQSAIKNNKYPDVGILAQRYVQSIIENDGKSQKIHTGNEAENIHSGLTDVAEDGSIRGSCAYPGKVQGIVRIIHDPTADNIFHQGDILVTGMTRPEYINLAKKSAGIITDAGGILSHAAITARELKKPCIIGTKHATKILKDGDMVEVDAENGVVRILEKKENIFDDDWELGATRNMSLWHDTLLSKGLSENLSDYGNIFNFQAMFAVENATLTTMFIRSEDIKTSCETIYELCSSGEKVRKLRKIYEKYAQEVQESIKMVIKKTNKKNVDKFFSNYQIFTAGLWITTGFGRIGLEELMKELRDTETAEDKIAEIVSIITYPEEHTPLFQSQEEMIDIGIKVQKNKLKNTEKEIKNWLKEHKYIPVNYCDNPWSEEDAQEQLESILEQDCEKLKKTFAENHKQKIQARNALRKKFNKKIRDLSDALAEATSLNEYRKNIFCRLSHDIRFFFEPLMERLGRTDWRDVYYCTPDEIRSIVEGNKLDIEKIKQDRERCVFVLENNEIVWADESQKEYFFNKIYKGDNGSGGQTITGFSANRGKITGTVKIVLSSRDFHKVSRGDILVTTMTSVDFVPVMERAGAFVTNEGGITTHAAIVSREMNKPCIVGTKNATKILKDGDMVEVDANNGVVKILENNDKEIVEYLKKTNCQLDWSGIFSLFHLSLCIGGYFGEFQEIFGKSFSFVYISYKRGIANAYLPSHEYREIGDHLASLSHNVNFRKKWINEFKLSADKIQIEINNLNAQNFLTKIYQIQKIYRLYTAYHVASKLVVNFIDIKEDEQLFHEFEYARKYSEKLFSYADSTLNTILDIIGTTTQFSHEQILFSLFEEFKGIYNNKSLNISSEKLSERHNQCGFYCNKDKYTVLASSGAKEIEHAWFDSKDNSIIKGTIAYPGKVTGTCRVLSTYKNANIQKGDILVTTMTEPDYLPLMKKARAFVTDGGGLLCHAAIVAREMKKPCIIGTKNATKILKDGDLVEVDAENGVVKILEKTQNEEWIKNVTREVTIFPAASVTKSFGKISKPFEIDFDYEHILFVGNTWYYKKSDYDKLKDILAKKIQEDTNYVQHIAKNQKEVGESLKKFVQKLNSMKISNKNIASHLREYDEKMTEFYSFWWIAIPVGEILEMRVRKILENHSEIDFDELMFVREELELVREKRLRNEIAIQCQRYKKYEDLPRIFEQKLIQHAEQFGWINTSYHVGVGLSARDFFEKIQAENPEESRKEMLEQRKREKNTITKLKKHLSKEDQSIIESMQTIMYLRNYQKETVNECQYKSEIFLRKIAQEIDLEWDTFLALSATEIQEYTKNKLLEKRYLEKAKKRQREFVIEWLNGEVSVYEENIEKYLSKVAKNTPDEVKIIHGTPAYKGKTSGTVRVINKKSDIELFIPGEILVANMTSIDYVHIMGRASAIITNEGGITCHAAIFSRELRIPCIIGSKNATQILKTGDLVEVDAENGVVNILDK